MHLNVTDHHTPVTIKLMNSNIPGLEAASTVAIEVLINLIEEDGSVLVGNYHTGTTTKRIKQRHSKYLFYYPKDLYVIITVRASKQTYATLDFNKNNLHTLDIYIDNVDNLKGNPDQLKNIKEILITSCKKFKYLL